MKGVTLRTADVETALQKAASYPWEGDQDMITSRDGEDVAELYDERSGDLIVLAPLLAQAVLDLMERERVQMARSWNEGYAAGRATAIRGGRSSGT